MDDDEKTLNNKSLSLVPAACVYRSSMEFAYGILLGQKLLCGSVHAAFVNTQWYEKWWERTLFVDPIVNDVPGLYVLRRVQGQPCDCHRIRHTPTG